MSTGSWKRSFILREIYPALINGPEILEVTVTILTTPYSFESTGCSRLQAVGLIDQDSFILEQLKN